MLRRVNLAAYLLLIPFLATKVLNSPILFGLRHAMLLLLLTGVTWVVAWQLNGLVRSYFYRGSRRPYRVRATIAIISLLGLCVVIFLNNGWMNYGAMRDPQPAFLVVYFLVSLLAYFGTMLCYEEGPAKSS